MSLAACAPISSGSGFLKSTLVYFDCAGRSVGEVGFATLTQPGSAIPQLILVAITLFIAWQGIRMMFGRMPDMGDAVMVAAKIGLVLMLVTSWPAVRTLFAEPSLAGPTELVAETRIHGPLALEDRLQRADDGIVTLTKWGTGKLDIRAGRTADGQPAASEFAGMALPDNLALGLGRLAFLVGSLLSLGLLKLLAGVMISALPVFAALLLFEASRALFFGWLRLVFALFVAGIAVPLILTVELSLLEPWLATAIEQRSAYLATPAAPTELLAIAASFLLILTGTIALIVRSCFSVDIAGLAARIGGRRRAEPAVERMGREPAPADMASQAATQSRAAHLALALDRLDQSPRNSPASGGLLPGRAAANDLAHAAAGRGAAMPGRRRARQRMALSHARRNMI